MGKPSGFMDYQRQDVAKVSIEQRTDNFSNIYKSLPCSSRKEQAGRCMSCGVPFCSMNVELQGKTIGCPLHNLIPEWNHQLWNDNLPLALERLLKTNCFPEFTGYVCPHPCESACNLGRSTEAVTINDNERSIIESCFEQGLVQPRPPKKRSGKKVAVIGSGPAGLTVAALLNQRGHSVIVYERDKRPGGLLTYGIPDMKLPQEVVDRRIRLLEEEGILFQCGMNIGTKGMPSVQKLATQYDAVILAIGAQEPRRLDYENDANGICYALKYLKRSSQARLGESELPLELNPLGKTVVIVGAGDTANDCIATALRQGARDIVQLIRRPASDYGPMNDYAHQETCVKLDKDIRRFGTQIDSIVADDNGNLTHLLLNTPDGQETIEGQMLVIASGFSGAETYAMAEGENVFHAGDMSLGASLVVRAMAHARKTARKVDEFLMGYSTIQ